MSGAPFDGPVPVEGPVPGESADMRVKRLRMRSWRRGTKEMDLILGPYADASLAGMGEAELDAYEALLAENDQDLYRWASGAEAPPARHAPLMARITSAFRAR